MWMSSTTDFHDSFCKCWHPFAHILDIIFPEGHKDRKLTIEEIINRDTQCHSGGDGEENLTLAAGEDPGTPGDHLEEEGDGGGIPDADLAELLAATEDATTR